MLSFSIPSESQNAWLFGYSRERILLGSGMLFGIFTLILAAGTLKSESGWLPRVDTQLKESSNLLRATLWLWAVFFFSLTAYIFSVLSLDGNWGPIPAILDRTFGILLWILLLSIQMLFFLNKQYAHLYIQPNFWDRKELKRFGLVILLGGVTCLHWIILIFQLDAYTWLDGWYFYFRPHGSDHLDWVFWLLWLSIPAIVLLVKKYRQDWRAVFLVFLWGYLLQIGFLWMNWGGFDPTAEGTIWRYSVYARAVTEASYPPMEVIRNYDTYYGENIFTGTKPPGFLLAYMLANTLANSLFSGLGGYTTALSLFVMFAYPAIAMIVLLPLYWFGREFLGTENATAPLLMLPVFPGMLLTTLFMDQTLYPTIFLILAWLAFRLTRKEDLLMAFGVGVLYYLALFITFAILPAIFFGMSLIGFHFLFFQRHWAGVKNILKLSVGIGAGFAGTYALFSHFLGYDALTRYQQAIETHRLAKSYPDGLVNLPGTILLNNVDFSLGAGFPTLILLAVISGGVLYRAFQRQPVTKIVWLEVAFFAMFIVLNLSGQTRSETARLWLFTLPLIALFITDLLNRIYPKQNWLFWWMAAQLLTTFLLFKFSRFY